MKAWETYDLYTSTVHSPTLQTTGEDKWYCKENDQSRNHQLYILPSHHTLGSRPYYYQTLCACITDSPSLNDVRVEARSKDRSHFLDVSNSLGHSFDEEAVRMQPSKMNYTYTTQSGPLLTSLLKPCRREYSLWSSFILPLMYQRILKVIGYLYCHHKVCRYVWRKYLDVKGRKLNNNNSRHSILHSIGAITTWIYIRSYFLPQAICNVYASVLLRAILLRPTIRYYFQQPCIIKNITETQLWISAQS